MIRSCLSRRVCLADAFSAGALSGAIRSRVRTTIAGQPCRATYATQASTATAPTASVEEVAQTQTRQEAPWQKELNKELKLQRAVRKQLDSLDDDPWKIGQHVENQLARDLFDEALLLTQKVSKDVQVAVAWNHLIGYQLEKQQLRRALKLFNEMKKRGQFPNMWTYTVIFRGLAKSEHPRTAVTEAIKHYNLLMADKRIQPNTVHLNAVLNVCAKAGDVDSMFLIADTANESTRSPDVFTYTTILNGLRKHHLDDLKGREDIPRQQRLANLQQAVDRSRGLWTEVMERWKQGRLTIDEKLVCAMARMLLLAQKREGKLEVLDLVQQTMNIPNMTKMARQSDREDPYQDHEMHDIAVTGTPKRAVQHTNASYVVPSRNTLALLLTTASVSGTPAVAIKYWNLLVRHYGIVPDFDNWLRLLGALKVAKASNRAVSAVALLPAEYVEPRVFSIAMETCVRDNINENVMENANSVLNLMVERLSPVPDLLTLRLYLRVALVSHFQFRGRATHGDAAAAKREYGIQIITALERLWQHYKTVHYHYFKASPMSGTAKGRAILYNDQREVIALARLMFSAFNKVRDEQMMDQQELHRFKHIGAKINREIQAFYSNREELEPKLQRSSNHAQFNSGHGHTAISNMSQDLPAKENINHRAGADFVWDTTKFGKSKN